MKFLRFLLLSAFFLAVVLCIFPAFLPSSGWDIQVEAKVRAEPTEVYDQVVDLSSWAEWSMFGDQEDSELTFEGPRSGPGAKLHWSTPMGWGDKKSVGTLTITEVEPGKSITYETSMEEGKGYSKGVIEFRHKEGDDETRIVWKEVGGFLDGDEKVEDGAAGYFCRYLGSLMQFTLSDGFEKNLDGLKEKVEDSGESGS